MPVSMKVKGLFFDSKTLIRRIGKAKAKSLSKGGAFLRRTSKGSIKTSKKPSRPGQPVKTRGEKIFPKSIFFSYDKATDSVVTGPVKLNHVFFNGDGKPVKGTVPEVLEKGGQIQVMEVFVGGPNASRNAPWNWRRADLRSRRRLAGKPLRLRKVKIGSRPTMGLALEKERRKLPELFRDTLGPGG